MQKNDVQKNDVQKNDVQKNDVQKNDVQKNDVSEETVVVCVFEEWHVAQAQRAAKTLARRLGFSEVAAYSLATSVSELANNLFFHTKQGGRITLSPLKGEQRVGIEIVSTDEGPGIENIKLAMQDGFTTNGGLGGGLPGVERLMDEFEIESKIGSGTRVVARKWGSLQDAK